MVERKEIPLQLQIDDDVSQGMYINMAMVNHNESEFTLDFIFVQPQEPKGKVRARVISSAKHTKRLMMALQDAVAAYERKFGAIDVTGSPPPSGQLVN